MHPARIFFDEPASALDPELVGEVLQVIETLAGEGMTMIVVSHELGCAREVADHVLFMDEGRVVEHWAAGAGPLGPGDGAGEALPPLDRREVGSHSNRQPLDRRG